MTDTTQSPVIIREVDPDEWEAMCDEHNGLVYKKARAWVSRFPTIDIEDLAQEGRLAIGKALESFDPAHGCKFSSYAGQVMDWKMRAFVQDHWQDVRVPRRISEQLWAAMRAGDDATSAKLSHGYAHLDEPQTEDGATLADAIADQHDQFAAQADNGQHVYDARKFLDGLDARKRRMFELYFGISCEPMRIMEVAEALGISRAAVEMQMRYAIRRFRSLRGMAEKKCYLRFQTNRLPARELLTLRPGDRITITRTNPPNHALCAFGRCHGKKYHHRWVRKNTYEVWTD